MTEFTVERFECTDGDVWYSVVVDGDVATGVMHTRRASADLEREGLAKAEGRS
jgi:hypothetical protein